MVPITMRTILLVILLALAAQATPGLVGHNFFSATGAFLAGTVSYTPTTGNFVVVTCTTWSPGGVTWTTQTISDGGHNTYTLDKSQYDGGRMTVSVYHAANVTGGAFTYTCAVTATTMWINLFVDEYNAMVTSSPLDGTPVANTGTGSPITSGNLTTTNAVDLLFAAWGTGDNNGTVAWTPTSGFTIIDSQTNANCCTLSGVMALVVSSTGSRSADLTRSPTSSFGFADVQVAYKGLTTALTRSTVSVQ